ncbi:hypothetical protein E5288_WYG019423 [Bos mutus]|uniref:Uncharacterized protein n=1 Tax=Bos mutus TaxID=72004 RepID=A0A6B0RAH7_9CETA|nr:hypothetical protein [Bos mutus]
MKEEAGHMLHNENPNQEGHIWGSMRRTAFILGSSLLLLMVHWNCVIGVDQCYAALGMLDYLHGTDTVFKQIKAYKRHMILLGFTPVSESIPDPPKMMD